MSLSSVKKSAKNLRIPAELSWVKVNYDQFDHISFFDTFICLNKSRAIRRFKLITNSWINDELKKKKLINDFNKWSKSKDSKVYWQQRTNSSEEIDSSITFSDSVMDTNTDTSSSVVINLTEEIERFFNENIQLPEVSNRYFIDDIDVSFIFYNYQQQIHEQIRRTTLTFKSNYHELLSLSSILLFEKNYSNNNIVKSFGLSKLEKISRQIKDHDLVIKNSEFAFESMIPVLLIVNQVYKKSITREEGCFNLMKIAIKFEGTYKVIVSFVQTMLRLFPMDDLDETIKEDDLKSRYVLPILQSLFDNLDDENLALFKITNENNLECKQKVLDVSRRRPDGQFRQKSENGNLITVGYLEAKPESESKNYKACKTDLVRLGIFGKNSIDVYKLKSTLLIQAIGSSLTFYVLQKKSEDVYTMIELDKLNIPLSIYQIPGIFGYLNRIANIVDIFKEYVRTTSSSINENEKIRKTMSSPIIQSLMLEKN